MNFRSTYVLLAIAGAMMALIVPKVFFAGKKAPGKGLLLQKFVASGFKPDDVTELTIEKSGTKPETLIFQRDSRNQWRLIKPISTRVNGYQVDSIVKSLMSAEIVSKGVDVSTKAKHNLENPPVKVTLRKGQDFSATLSVGSLSVGSNEVYAYVLSGDVPTDRPLVTKKTSLAGLFRDEEPKDLLDTASRVKGVEDFRQTKLLGDGGDPVGQTQSITLRKGPSEVVLSREGETWKFVVPAGFGEAESVEPQLAPGAPPNPDINNIRKLINTVYDLAVSNTKDYDDAPTDLKSMGLAENPDMLTIQIAKRAEAGQTPTTETISLGKTVEGADKQEKVYARVSGDSSVAKINAAPVQALVKVLQQPKTLRSHDLVKLPLQQVDAIDVEVGGSTFELRSTGPGAWNLYDASGNRYTANALAVNQLLEALTRQGQIVDFPPVDLPDANLGIDPKNRSGEVRIWVDGVVQEKKEEPKKEEAKKDDGKKKDEPKKEEPKKEEPKKEEPKAKPKLKGEANVKIDFGSDTGSGVYVRRLFNGNKLDAVLPKAIAIEVVKKTYLDFVEPALKPFVATDVVKLNFNRGSEQFELTKDGTDWKFLLPAKDVGRLPDNARINSVVGQLSRLRPTRVVSDSPKPDQLKTWKLEDANNVLHLTMTDKTGKQTIYLFGENVGSEKLNVYFRTPEEKFVYELPKLFLDNLAQGELADPAIYRIDKAKLRKINMRGWAENGTPVERKLELKDGKWTFNPKQDYEPDPEKIENFLADSLAPKPEATFPKANFGPEHGLDVSKGALQIDFITEDGKTVILLLGAADKDGKSVFARSNQPPGELFTLLKDRFKTLREKPTIFKKE